MVNEENWYQDYKGQTKWLSLKSSYLTQKDFFGMTLLHAHAQYIYIVNTKDRKPSVKALVQVDFPVYAQAKSLFKSKQKKMAHFKRLLFCQKTIFWYQTSSCKCSMCLYCVGKVLNCFGTSCGTSWIPRICTIYTRHTKLLSSISSYFAKKYLYLHDTSSCTCSIYLYCICKVSESFSKSSGTSWLPRVCTI